MLIFPNFQHGFTYMPRKAEGPLLTMVFGLGWSPRATLSMNVEAQESTGKPPLPPQLEMESQLASALGRNQFCWLC